MLGDTEKKAFISSTSKDWPQNQSNENNMMMANSAHKVMEKSSSQEQQQEALKCPRCGSTNTKFCYYNNYSLSQPRHFCKACKRYWTRGGTLRNVPVGGGCRKNKRLKRSASATSEAEAQIANPSIPAGQAQISISSSSAPNLVNPLLFGLPSNPCEMNPSLSRFSNVSGHGLQAQLNNLGLGYYSSGFINNDACESYVQNGFDISKNIKDMFGSKSVLSSYLGNSSSCHTSSSPSMASLISSNLQQQRFINGDMKEADSNQFHVLGSQIACNSENKDVKAEGKSRMNYHDEVDQQNGLTDSSLCWNATTNVGSWHDQANMNSGVTFLI